MTTDHQHAHNMNLHKHTLAFWDFECVTSWLMVHVGLILWDNSRGTTKGPLHDLIPGMHIPNTFSLSHDIYIILLKISKYYASNNTQSFTAYTHSWLSGIGSSDRWWFMVESTLKEMYQYKYYNGYQNLKNCMYTFYGVSDQAIPRLEGMWLSYCRGNLEVLPSTWQTLQKPA